MLEKYVGIIMVIVITAGAILALTGCAAGVIAFVRWTIGGLA